MSRYRSMRQRKKLDAHRAMVRRVEWEWEMVRRVQRFATVDYPRLLATLRRIAQEDPVRFLAAAAEVEAQRRKAVRQ